MRRVAVMQPYLFPYVGYFQMIAAIDVFVVLDDVPIPGGGFVNRNRLIIGGTPRWFSLPVEKRGHREPLSSRLFLLTDRWTQNLIGNIKTHYRPSVQRNDAIKLAELTRPSAHFSHNVVSVNTDLVRATLVTMKQDIPEVILSSEVVPKDSNPIRRLLSICHQLGADTFINLPGGRVLYDPAHFAQAGLRLGFIRPHPEPYSQTTQDFQPWMSILDVIANTTEEERERVLSAYDVDFPSE